MKHQNQILKSLKITKCQNLYISHWDEHPLLFAKISLSGLFKYVTNAMGSSSLSKTPKLLIFPNMKLFTKMSVDVSWNIKPES